MHRYWWNLALKVSHTWTYITVYRGRSKLSSLYLPLKIHHQSTCSPTCRTQTSAVRKYSCTITPTWFSYLSYDAIHRWFLTLMRLFALICFPPSTLSHVSCLAVLDVCSGHHHAHSIWGLHACVHTG